jgi:phosphohistidine swiveling domain-containing protein
VSVPVAPPELQQIRFFGPGICDPEPSKESLGGKAYSLMTMTRDGLPVPPGFVLTTRCCAEYYAFGGRWPDGLEEELRRAVDWLERTTGRVLGRGPRPLLVAVRSGAAQSMPGMMDTVLNVGLHPDLESCAPDADRFWSDVRDFTRAFGETVRGLPEEVFERVLAPGGTPREQALRAREAYLEALKEGVPSDPWEQLRAAVGAVFRSWESERARTYRDRHNLRGLAGTAVTVMAMFPSERSGILFTEDPNRPDQGRILVEASYGLGEAIVRGHVEPDTFCIDRSTMTIVERRVGTGREACIGDAQALDLARLGLKVEAHVGAPVDVEWGIAEGRQVLLQSRPIRGLDVLRAVPRVREEEIRRLEALSKDRPRAAWALHNLAETLPAPTPLTWDVIGRGFMGDGFLRLYRDLGFVPSERVSREGFLELIAGRIYADVERSAELFFEDFPMGYDVDGPGRPSEVLLGRPTRFDVERAGPAFLLKLPLHLARMIRAGRAMKREVRTGLEDLRMRVLPAFQAFVAECRRKPLATMSDAELLDEAARRERVGLNEFGPALLKPGFLAGYHHGRVSSTLELALGPQEGRALTARLLAGLEGDKTVESNIQLYRVARGELSLEAYLEEYGHRAVNELELAEPRWKEDPAYLRQRVQQLARDGSASPAALHDRKRKERLEAELSVARLLAENGASALEEEFREDLRGAQEQLPRRETCKHAFILGVSLVRDVLEVLAARWDLGRDLYFLRRAELGGFKAERPARLREIADRKLRWSACQRLEAPELLRARDLQALGREEERRPGGDGIFEGSGVASGVGTGRAKILRSPSEAGELAPGYVLVCPTTDPSWTPLFVHAAGIVVERGGMLSHGAIVARDFGIPAVVLPGATRLIAEGVRVRIDGNRGRVELQKEAS